MDMFTYLLWLAIRSGKNQEVNPGTLRALDKITLEVLDPLTLAEVAELLLSA